MPYITSLSCFWTWFVSERAEHNFSLLLVSYNIQFDCLHADTGLHAGDGQHPR